MIGRELRRWLMNRGIDAFDGRRQRILAWNLLSRCGITRLQFERDGILWSLRPQDDIGWILFVDGGYHIVELELVAAWLRHHGLLAGSRDVIVDAGANIGTTCVPLVRALGCRAVAIEPVADNFDALRTNVETNGLGERIRLVRKAISRDRRRVRMCLTRGASGGCFVASGGESEVPPSGIEGFEEVEAGPLADLVAEAGVAPGEVAFVWADVQGCELDVIESGAPFWSLGVPLWAEVEPHSLRRQGALEIFAEAAARHFRAFIDSEALQARGLEAEPVPISALPGRIASIRPPQVNTDMLLLP